MQSPQLVTLEPGALSNGSVVLSCARGLSSMVHFFPVAAATNCHKPGDLKQQAFVLSQFWRPEFQRQYHEAQIKVGRIMLPKEAWGDPALDSSAPGAAGILWLWLHLSRTQYWDLQLSLYLPPVSHFNCTWGSS